MKTQSLQSNWRVVENQREALRTCTPDWSFNSIESAFSKAKGLQGGKARRIPRPDGRWALQNNTGDVRPTFYDRNNPVKIVKSSERVQMCEDAERKGTWKTVTKRLPVEKIDENGNKITIWVRLVMLEITLTTFGKTFTFKGKQGAGTLLDSRDNKRKSIAYVKSEIARLGIKVTAAAE